MRSHTGWGVTENAIRKLVGPSKPESKQLALPAIANAAKEPAASDAPSATSAGEYGDRITASGEENTAERTPVTSPEAANDDEPVPMSLDRDASDRTLDRQLAYLGLLDDAAPLFREGSSVPGVGVLLALPCLVESGVFRISPPALRSTAAPPQQVLTLGKIVAVANRNGGRTMQKTDEID